MDEARFWQIIESTQPRSGLMDRLVSKARLPERMRQRHLAALRQALEAMPAEEVAAFDRQMRQRLHEANTWDLWGAAYVIDGGCSDDGFEYFRAWLISQGREVFRAAVASADSLADVDALAPYENHFEEFMYVASQVYEGTTGGQELPREPDVHSSEARGVPFDEAEVERLIAKYPRLSAKFGGG